MTTDQLFTAFRNGDQVTLSSQGIERRGIIQVVEREDGSGLCWNVKIHSHSKWIFVRTKP